MEVIGDGGGFTKNRTRYAVARSPCAGVGSRSLSMVDARETPRRRNDALCAPKLNVAQCGCGVNRIVWVVGKDYAEGAVDLAGLIWFAARRRGEAGAV